MSFKIPILFQVFNRLDTSLQVFSKIKEIRPLNLFIVQDGARKDKINESQNCLLVRSRILEQIDWDCELVTYFRDENMGPGAGTGEAIKWFFNQVEYGIFLEHDCLPHSDFFEYCKILLEKYKNESQVMLITGSNYQKGKKFGEGSYYFGVCGQFWGWASWERALINYDYNIDKYSQEDVFDDIKYLFKNKKERDYWQRTYFYLKNKEVDTWDYQLLFKIWHQKGLIIMPNNNLISNIGFGVNSIHCKDENSPLANAKTLSILPIAHIYKIKRNYKSDRNFMKNTIFYYQKTKSLKKIIRKILPDLLVQFIRFHFVHNKKR